jgi:peptidylprolyl isomerase
VTVPSKPDVAIPTGDLSGELVVLDLVEGDGETARPGQQVVVHYVGVAHSTGQEFDSSYGRGAPFTFPLGEGRVIAGWDQGVQGMRIGGRRQLIIPPHLGYGDRGAGGAIKGGETLVFVVDLIGLR